MGAIGGLGGGGRSAGEEEDWSQFGLGDKLGVLGSVLRGDAGNLSGLSLLFGPRRPPEAAPADPAVPPANPVATPAAPVAQDPRSITSSGLLAMLGGTSGMGGIPMKGAPAASYLSPLAALGIPLLKHRGR